jgi:hypothetical protein
MLVHIFSGTIIAIITIVMSLIVIEYYAWRLLWRDSLHSALGLAILFVTVLITILGYLAWGASFNPKTMNGGLWNLVHSLQIKAIHKLLGYGLVLAS